MTKLIFEKDVAGANSFQVPSGDESTANISRNLPGYLIRESLPDIPSLSEIELVRHFTELSYQAYGVDNGFYPLGSCTMKYNPKINEWASRLPGLAHIHPYQAPETVQGALQLLYDMGNLLSEITGMDSFTLQPAAGAQGEMTGIMMIKAYHNKRGDHRRTKIMVPDSAHGTNPATANMAGYEVVEIKSDTRGLVDIDDLKAKMSDEVAGLMLTNPNTLGLFEEEILEIAAIVHEGGGLLYYDGANLNAIMGICRPGDMGFDVMHLNLHKTFSTPHGGGGPGSGPVGVKGFLAGFLPRPVIIKDDDDHYEFDYNRPESIGKVKNYYGNFGVIVKAYTYIMALGHEGIRNACQHAVLNANYLRHHLQNNYHIPFNQLCKHEFVMTARHQMEAGQVSTLDIAKRLMDYGYHPPTVYFPLIVKEAMMIEPTETESRERLDSFIEAMNAIAEEVREEPQKLIDAPHTTPIGRVDEVKAARIPVVKWEG